MQRVVVQSDQIQGSTLTLTHDQGHYLQRVLRLGPGGQFLALDGQGRQWIATLGEETGQATLGPVLVVTRPTLAAITLAVALPKQGFDQVVRQATELGVECIVPIVSDRTLLRPSSQKLQRWQRIATEAAEQCERPTVPQILPPHPWLNWLEHSPPDPQPLDPQSLDPQPLDPQPLDSQTLSSNSPESSPPGQQSPRQQSVGQHYLCVARRNSLPLAQALQGSPPVPAITVATGPEGGWTAVEIERAIAAGYCPVSLSPYILRAVTAPLVALSLTQSHFHAVNSEFS